MTGKGGPTIGDMSEVSEEEEKLMREHYKKVFVKPSNKARGQPRIHLKEGDEPLCNSIRGRLNEKPFSVFPPGYFDVCRTCAAYWRKEE